MALAGAFDCFTEIQREQYLVENAKKETFIDVLVRYGNRYQMDQAFVSNSLFGGEDVVEVATPEIPKAERWNNIERLNKERELVGIYLSAHPLDEYAVVLDYACNTRLTELNNLSALMGRKITMGGFVSSVRRGIDKKGRNYSIINVEDFSGSGEIRFFGNDWVAYQGYLQEGNFLFIKAKVQNSQWRPNEPELKITSMDLLSEVKEQLIEKITVTIPLNVLNEALVNKLDAIVKKHPGSAELFFKVVDEESRMDLDLVARPVKVSVDNELVTFLKERPELGFCIN